VRNVIYSMLVSLDGFVAGPNRELGWHLIDEELHTFVNEQQRALGAFLYGRRLYEDMAAYWPTADTNPSAPAYEVEFARIWKDTPKVVFSKTLERVEWNSRLVRDDIAEEVTRLKGQPGKDMSLAGPTLTATCMRLGLIDEYQLFVHPVVIGSGPPFFPTLGDAINLRLMEMRTFGSGVVYLRYRRAGEGQ